MKGLISALILWGLLLQPVRAMAAPTEFSGGVNNEYEYTEYVFLSGQPVKFSGTYKITDTTSKDKRTIGYTFSLTPADASVSGKLSRTVTYTVTYNDRNDKGQTIAQTALTRYTESVDLDGAKYNLRDFQFSKSDIIDNRPVSDFYSGNIKGRKYYTINNTQGKATVDISGGNVGYENFWGNTDTQIIDYVINVERPSTGEAEADLSWHGTVKVQVSDSTTKTLRYSENAASFTSIEGGYMKVTAREMVSKYDYDLPRMSDGVPDDDKRKSGTVELSQQMVPKVERLIVPKFRDIGGHWAEEDIKRLYSLDVFDETAQFFNPQLPMTRTEYTKAVMRSCNIRPVVSTKKTTTSSRNKTPEVSQFNDVATTDPSYEYIKDAVNKGIIQGVSKSSFKPEDPLTRAAAVVVLIRALGFEGKAPTPGYATAFDDDGRILSWAKDSVYVAREIGLVSGDSRNNFNPDQQLTRAEASALLVKFLKFLEQDLQKDYRENIILYN